MRRINFAKFIQHNLGRIMIVVTKTSILSIYQWDTINIYPDHIDNPNEGWNCHIENILDVIVFAKGDSSLEIEIFRKIYL